MKDMAGFLRVVVVEDAGLVVLIEVARDPDVADACCFLIPKVEDTLAECLFVLSCRHFERAFLAWVKSKML